MHVQRIPERHVEGMRLGRHIRHDPRSRRFQARAADLSTLQSITHERHVPIFDQGDLGSCTGNAALGCLGTGGFYATLPADNPDRPGPDADADERIAVKLYSAATTLDGYAGAYPPDDTGSDGLSVAKACQQAGTISGYTHAMGFQAALTALSKTPLITGVNWYDSFDDPDKDGVITIARGARVRGGHEFVLSALDMERRRVKLDNSWSTGWGLDGSAFLPFDDFERLLSEDGDVTVFTPLTEPAPTPDPEGCLGQLLGELRNLIAKYSG